MNLYNDYLQAYNSLEALNKGKENMSAFKLNVNEFINKSLNELVSTDFIGSINVENNTCTLAFGSCTYEGNATSEAQKTQFGNIVKQYLVSLFGGAAADYAVTIAAEQGTETPVLLTVTGTNISIPDSIAEKIEAWKKEFLNKIDTNLVAMGKAQTALTSYTDIGTEWTATDKVIERKFGILNSIDDNLEFQWDDTQLQVKESEAE